MHSLALDQRDSKSIYLGLRSLHFFTTSLNGLCKVNLLT